MIKKRNWSKNGVNCFLNFNIFNNNKLLIWYTKRIPNPGVARSIRAEGTNINKALTVNFRSAFFVDFVHICPHPVSEYLSG